jgi:hypothetical protein
LSTAERVAAITRQLENERILTKDQDIAFLIEFLGGLVGLLGLGYFYVGLTNAGLVRLLGFWAAMILVWTLFGAFSVLTLGFGACLFIVPLAFQLVLVFLSASDLKTSTTNAKTRVQAAQASPTLGSAPRPAPSLPRQEAPANPDDSPPATPSGSA